MRACSLDNIQEIVLIVKTTGFVNLCRVNGHRLIKEKHPTLGWGHFTSNCRLEAISHPTAGVGPFHIQRQAGGTMSHPTAGCGAISHPTADWRSFHTHFRVWVILIIENTTVTEMQTSNKSVVPLL